MSCQLLRLRPFAPLLLLVAAAAASFAPATSSSPVRAADATPGAATSVAAATSEPAKTNEPAKTSDSRGCEPRLRAVDEFWSFSTRQIDGCDSSDELPPIAVHQYQPSGEWRAATLAEFFAGAAETSSVFYLHGNRVDANQAIAGGWRVYHALQADDVRPFRLVVWSWPSDQVRGPLRDIRSKAYRADEDARHLGRVLARLPAGAPVGLFGYSYGARITTGGLHLAAGGTLDGLTISGVVPGALQAGVVLMAAAEHHDWIAPQHRHGAALDSVDRLLNVYNSCDPVLARYRFVDRCESPLALGAVGVAPESLGAAASRVEQRDAAGSVGKTHDEAVYFHYGVSADELRRILVRDPSAR